MYLQDTICAVPPTVDALGQDGTPWGMSKLRTGSRTTWNPAEVDALIPILRQKYSHDGERFYSPSNVYKDPKQFTANHKQSPFQIQEALKRSMGSGLRPGGAGEG
mmetsp:Transcript_16395/g.26539  ORF Transcript_16395/g.26539 Transcript_16395/m.26539 type:complete len:105 (+) Transcript_16395:796-1110(+)